MGGRIKIALALFVLLMLPLGLLTSCQTTAKSGLAATVNGEEITDKDLDKEYKKISKRFEGTPQGAMADEQKKRMQKQLLLSLMENILMEQQAEKAGVKISKKEIDKRFKQFQTGRSKKEFTEQLKQAGLTQTTLKDQIGDNLLREQLRKKVAKTKKPTDKEMRKYYKDNESQFKGAEGKLMPYKEVKFRIEQLMTAQSEQEAWAKWLDKIKEESDVRIWVW